MYGVCLKISHDEQVAQDLTQDTFVKAIRALSDFHGQASFSTWLYQIAMRRCLDYRRQMNRYPQWVPLEVEQIVGDEASDHPADKLVRQEEKEQLHRWVESLEMPYRRVIQMYYFEEQSYRQIAQSTGMSEKTIESQLYRARRMLRAKGGDDR